MRLVLAGILVGHGLIHIAGFLAAFGLAEVGVLRNDPSRPAGILWLVAAVLLVASGVLLFAFPARWSQVAVIALVLSQGLIVSSWGDAKFGTLANVVVMFPVLVALLGQAPWSPRARFAREVSAGSSRVVMPPALLTDGDLAPLPGPVREYLRFAGAVGKPRVVDYKVSFTGGLRSGPNDPWMKATVEQWSTHEPSSRRFLLRARRYGVPFDAFHRYVGGSATFEVRIASLFPVIDARGAEMDQSETVTLLNDMAVLAPATLIDSRIQWEPAGDRIVRAIFTNEGHTVSATLAFDGTGALVDFWSDDRYRTVDGRTYEKARWSTPVATYREADGRKVPVHAEARWTVAGTGFAYARLDVVDIAYNLRVR